MAATMVDTEAASRSSDRLRKSLSTADEDMNSSNFEKKGNEEEKNNHESQQPQKTYHHYSASQRSHSTVANNSTMGFKKKTFHAHFQPRWQRNKPQNHFSATNYYNANSSSANSTTGTQTGSNSLYQMSSTSYHRRNSKHKNAHQQMWVNQEEDENLTKSLRSILLKQGVFEHSKTVRKRKAVLKSIEEILCKWSASLLKSRTENEASRVALISFGSYRLGVQRSGADLDALALSPPHCTRADFFSSLVKMLHQDTRVTDLHPVPGAYTPVLKFYMDGIAIDLLFARLVDGQKLITEAKQQELNADDGSSSNSSVVSTTDEEDGGATKEKKGSPSSAKPTGDIRRSRFELEIDDTMLIGLDEAGVRSLNGVRVAQLILHLVPNVKTFRLTLRAVKEWALIHGLYSNVLGFLGGINWAILVAWVCKRNPSSPAATILKLFFVTFARWKWPMPVKLLSNARNPPPGVMPLQVWDPKSNPRDRAHIMPIITPAYPSMNSSYNVGQPQLRRIQNELQRSLQILKKIGSKETTWSELFQGNDFFRQHVHYLQVNIIARNAKDFRAWFGLCESRLRILIAGLESPEYGIQAYPFAKFYNQKIDCTDESVLPNMVDDKKCKYTTAFFIALRFAYGVENVDLKSCTSEFLYKVNAWEERRYGMDLTIEHVLQQNLPSFVFDEEKEKQSSKLDGIPSLRDATNLPKKSIPSVSDNIHENGKKINNSKLCDIDSQSEMIERIERPCDSPPNPSPMKKARFPSALSSGRR